MVLCFVGAWLPVQPSPALFVLAEGSKQRTLWSAFIRSAENSIGARYKALSPCLLCWVTYGTLGQAESKLALFTGKQATVVLARRRELQAEAPASLYSNVYCAVHQ